MKQSSLEDSRQSDPVQHYDNAGVMKKSLVEDRAQKRFRGEPMQRYNNAVVMKQSSSEERPTKSSDLSSDASSHSRQPRPFLSSNSKYLKVVLYKRHGIAALRSSQKKRKLTLSISRYSPVMIEGSGELPFAIPGDDRRKGTTKFA
nr:uncharacterized protein LOC127329290 [Lolium perenne]